MSARACLVEVLPRHFGGVEFAQVLFKIFPLEEILPRLSVCVCVCVCVRVSCMRRGMRA